MPLPPFSVVISALSDRLFLNGLVIPNGSATTAQFEYGLTNSYGSVQAVTLGTPDATIAQQVSASISGLTPNTTYHYRLTATNVNGTSSTTDRVLRTMDYSYHTSHLAGTTGGGGMTDGTGRAARFVSPRAITSAPGGHFYVVDYLMNTIRKVTADGLVTTFAGVAGQAGSVDGFGAAALFFAPRDVAVDQSGNLYVTDSGNHTLRKITSDGLVTTLAGSAGMSGSADGTGSSARFLSPQGIALDATGNVYVSSNQTIRKITSAGVVTTLAGLAGVTGSADGAGSVARFNSPAGMVVVADGSLLVADLWNNTIRKIDTATGAVSTLAGLAGSAGQIDGTGSQARLLAPMNLALDADGTVLVLSSSSIRRVTPVGVVSTLSGPGGVEDLAVSPAGEFFFTRSFADGPAVYRQNSIGVVSLLAGDPPERGSQDGPAEMARFNQPAGAGADGAGNIYVTDIANHTIRKVSNAGSVTTLAGLAGVSGSTDGAGSAARLTTPSDLAVDSSGNVFVASNSAVRKITPDGIVSTLAALAGEIGSRIAVDGNGNVFLTKGHAIQKVTSSGSVSTFAGDFLVSGSLDGTGTGARFNQPRGLVADGAGNLYVADSFNYTIRKITPEGVVTTFAGMAGQNGVVDGSGSSARFAFMDGLSLDESGNLYVSPGFPFRRISPSGEVTSFLPADLDTTVWPFFAAKSLVPLSGGSFCLVNDFEHKLLRLTPGPLVGRISASGLNTTTATLNARLDPNAATTTTALFEYGTSTSYGSTAAVTLSPDSGVAEQSVSASLSGLLPATTYHYRLTATNARGTNTTSNGTFTTLNLQQGWRQTYFGSPSNEGNAADTFDHDGDGIVNLLEWATGLNPTINSTLPASSTVSGTDIEYHYTRLVAAIAAGAIFTVEWNDTLSPLGWSSAGVVETILSNNGTTQQVKATLPAGSSGKRFVRLRVTGAP